MDKTPTHAASKLPDSAGGQAGDPPTSVLVGEVAESARQAAEDLASRARHAAEEQLNGAKQKVADSIGRVADALRATGDQLHSREAEAVGGYVDQTVERLDAASGYLQSRSLSEMLTDVEGLARRQPALFLAGGFLLGLIGGRFFKSTSSPRSSGAQDA